MKFHSQGNFDVSSMHYIHFVPDDGSFEDTFLQRKTGKNSGQEHVEFDVNSLVYVCLLCNADGLAETSSDITHDRWWF